MPSRINSPFSLGLPESPVTKDKNNYSDIAQLYNAVQILQQAMSDYGGIISPPSEYWSELALTETVHPQNNNRLYPISSENIAAGAVINLYSNAGVLNVRNANATNNTKPCHGFSPSAIVSPARGEIILFNGLCISIAGMTLGSRYFLSTTNGLITAVAPVAAGNIEQALGLALSTTVLYFLTDLDFIQH